MTTAMTNTMTMNNPGSSILADVHSILGLLDAFAALLARETKALKAADYSTVDALQTQKKEFAKGYQELVTTLAARQSEIGTLDMALREKLVRSKTAFTLTLKDNLSALEAAKDSAKRLVNRILDVARKTVTEECQTGYSAKGNAQAYKSSSLSLRVDQQL